MFTGLLGLSVSLNGGIAKQSPETTPETVASTFKFNPRERRAVNA
jgi:hypothetical protein